MLPRPEGWQGGFRDMGEAGGSLEFVDRADLAMHVVHGREHRHHDFTSHLVLCQVASSLCQLGVQVAAQSKLLDHVDAFIILKGSIDLDNAWVLQ